MSKDVLHIKIEKSDEIDRFISILSLGLCYSIQEELISNDVAEGFLYNPDVFDSLKKLGLNKILLDNIHHGWEMEALEIVNNDAYKTVMKKRIEILKEHLKKIKVHEDEHWIRCNFYEE